jgi:uroporphyrinogen-III synthase
LQADAILFTSSSTVNCFASQFKERGAVAVCIGRQTAQAAERAGFARIAVANTATEAGLIDALLHALKKV